METTLKYGGCPWLQPTYKYGNGVIGLHEEIEHFYRYILPTPCEHAVRCEVVQRVEHLIHKLWPQAFVMIFGSFRTGLCLPQSDIDLVVLGRWDKLPLRTLESELVASGIAEPNSMRVVDTAVVPIVKFRDCKTKLNLDLSFNMPNGVLSDELIKKFKRDFPGVAKLVLVLKQFLLQRDLNSAFSGGISSHSLILMCISFLQLHPRDNFHDGTNLGVLLLEFFELYGLRFNYAQIGITIANGGCYERKEHMCNGDRMSPLYIADPIQTGNHNVARSSYAIVHLKQAFQYAYRVLSQAVQTNDSYDSSNSSSTLGCIIHITDELIDYRAWLNKRFDHLVVVETTSPTCAQIKSADDYVILENGDVRQVNHQPQTPWAYPQASSSFNSPETVNLIDEPLGSPLSPVDMDVPRFS